MKLILGSELSKENQKQVLAVYVHRFTKERKPFWTRGGDKPHFKDDADWLAHTRFQVTKVGRISKRSYHCESTPTWPDGKPGEYANKCLIVTGAA